MKSPSPDGAPVDDVLAYLRSALSCHADEVRFLGNLRIGDALRALTLQDIELQKLRAVALAAEIIEDDTASWEAFQALNAAVDSWRGRAP